MTSSKGLKEDLPKDPPAQSPEQEKAISLANAEWFNLGLYLKGPEALAVTRGLFRSIHADRIREHRVRDKEMAERAISVVLANLLNARRLSEGRYVAYSRAEQGYPAGNYLTKEPTMKVIDYLAAEGFIENVMGVGSGNQWAAGYGKSYRSRMRATPFLWERCRSFVGGDPKDWVACKPTSDLELRGFKPQRDFTQVYPRVTGDKLDFAETRHTKRLREGLLKYNELMEGVEVSIPSGVLDDSGRALDVVGGRYVRRVFHGDFRGGGRYAGSFWMNMKKADRLRVRLDGHALVELDYEACQPRLCYHLAVKGVPKGFRPYELEGIEREGAKVTFQRFIYGKFTNSFDAAAKPGEAPYIRSGFKYCDVVREMAEKHAVLSDIVGPKLWATLQFLESSMMAINLEHLILWGVPCLHVHDALLVPKGQEERTKEVMKTSYARTVTNGREWSLEGDPVIRECV